MVYTWPVKGQVLRGFTVEALAYDETMGDWRTHGGIDIAAEEGRKVLAAGEGQVAEVYDDAMMGTTVTVLQPDGVTAVYSNLAQGPAVAVGDAVDTGTVLGRWAAPPWRRADWSPTSIWSCWRTGSRWTPWPICRSRIELCTPGRRFFRQVGRLSSEYQTTSHIEKDRLQPRRCTFVAGACNAIAILFDFKSLTSF